jgi:kynureninase
MVLELRNRALLLDRDDELAHCRNRFRLPDGLIYLCGNSLGAMPAGIAERLARSVTDEWAEGLVKSWNTAGWIELPRVTASHLARLIGADPECVAVTDSTSVNLFKVLSAALALNPGRRRIVSERDNFPTDLYIADGLVRFLGGRHELVLVDHPDEIGPALDDRTAVLMLSHVNYRTGRLLDMKRITELAHAAGALAIWDLAHSAGAIEVDVTGCNVDFAVGCGYKYLNGGPGAPAFLYVSHRHAAQASQPLSGWFSHREPFAFDPAYAPAAGIARFHTGTPPILSMVALNEALNVWRDVDMAAIRRKSVALTDLFIEAVERLCPQLRLVTPRDPQLRGSQICLSTPEGGHAIMRALIAHGVVGDFRAPDILRFGFAPLYNRFEEAVRAAEILADILEREIWRQPEFQIRERVT